MERFTQHLTRGDPGIFISQVKQGTPLTAQSSTYKSNFMKTVSGDLRGSKQALSSETMERQRKTAFGGPVVLINRITWFSSTLISLLEREASDVGYWREGGTSDRGTSDQGISISVTCLGFAL